MLFLFMPVFLCETIVASGVWLEWQRGLQKFSPDLKRKVALPHSKLNKAALAQFTFHNNEMAAHCMCKLDAWNRASTKEHPA